MTRKFFCRLNQVESSFMSLLKNTSANKKPQHKNMQQSSLLSGKPFSDVLFLLRCFSLIPTVIIVWGIPFFDDLFTC